MEKMEKDGMVAVLYSPGYGAGWSTWSSEHAEFALFDKGLVELALKGADSDEVEEYVKEKLGDDYFYTGGWRDIQVRWVPKGSAVVVDEYDGNESICLLGEVQHHIA